MRRQFEIGLDLGSANVVAVAPGRGVVVWEPSVVAIDVESGWPVAWGRRAALLFEASPDRYYLAPVGPWHHGGQRHLALYVLSALARTVCGTLRMAKPRAVLQAPSAPGPLCLRSMVQLVADAGLMPAGVVHSTVAIWVDAGAPAGDTLVVDIGARRTDIALIRGGSPAWSVAVRAGMECADRRLQLAVRERMMVRLGQGEARRVREARNGFSPNQAELSARGMHVETRLPVDVSVPVELIDEAVEGVADAIADAVKAAGLLCEARSAVVAGGGALQYPCAARIGEAAGISCIIAPEPQLAAARGLVAIAECGISRVTNASVSV
ncbi:MAG: rod shape-determining protein [Bacillota bacterium]|jgi:rod shape-determining protein MreB